MPAPRTETVVADTFGPSAETEQGTIEQFYLQTADTASYTIVHRPTGRRSGLAVLMCPSYGWDELCIHRIKYRWANELAGAGHTVLRFDLPGTGDSAGEPTEPEQLQRWLQSLTAAASWLRQDGASRVVGFGVGLGALLSWLAAAGGAPLDDLILWQVPRSGRRLVRSIQAAAQLSFATEGGADPRSGADPLAGTDPFAGTESQPGARPTATATPAAATDDPLCGGFIEESGQVMTAELIAALSAVDLTANSLSGPATRHVLCYVDETRSADRATRDWLNGTGVQLTVADGHEFGAMMRYVQISDPPWRAIARSLRWLAELPCSPRTDAGATPAVRTSATLELTQPGQRCSETAFALPLYGQTLRGTVTEPLDVPWSGVTAIFLSGADDRRIGPSRAWVQASRRWAAYGMRSIRIDLAGLGDSDGPDDTWRDPQKHFKQAAAAALVPLLDALANRGYGERFVMAGFCTGGLKSARLSFIDQRVIGAFWINVQFLAPSRVYFTLRESWLVSWRPKPHTTPTRERIMRIVQWSIPRVDAARMRGVRLLPRVLDGPKQAFWDGAARGVEYLLLIKPRTPALRDIELDPRRDRLPNIEHVTVLALPDKDSRFRTLPGREMVHEQLDLALARVLARNGALSAPVGVPGATPTAGAARVATVERGDLDRATKP